MWRSVSALSLACWRRGGALRWVVLTCMTSAWGCRQLEPERPPDEQVLRWQLQRAQDAAWSVTLRGRAHRAEESGVDVQSAALRIGSRLHPVFLGDGGLFEYAVEGDLCCSEVTLHVVDSRGAHWVSSMRPDWSSVREQVVDLGEVILHPEQGRGPGLVLDDNGTAQVGASIVLGTYQALSDTQGGFWLCGAAAVDPHAVAVVYKEGFAPWVGPLAWKVELDRGGSVLGSVPPDVVARANGGCTAVLDLGRLEAGSVGADYLRLSANVENGRFSIQSVPSGDWVVVLRDRTTGLELGQWAPVKVSSGTVSKCFGFEATQRRHLTWLFVDGAGTPVTASCAFIQLGDLLRRETIENGVMHLEEFSRVKEVRVPGYGVYLPANYHDNQVVSLRGGYRVVVRLSLNSARRLPLGCRLRVLIPGLEPDSVRYLTSPVIALDRDVAVMVPSPGNYHLDVEVIRSCVTCSQARRQLADVRPRTLVVAEARETQVFVIDLEAR